MKTFIPIIAIAVALSLPATAARGQDAVAQDAMAKAQAEIQRAQADAQREFEQARQQYERARGQMEDQVAQVNMSGGGGGGGWGGSGAGGGGGAPRIAEELSAMFKRTHVNSGRTLVIRSSETDPKEQANLEEDLAVMSHIFDKTIAEQIGEHPASRSAMGIEVFFAPGANSIRNMYLDGYGALFMLNVNFPLLAPPTKTEEQKEKPQTDSTWQEARQELYGRSANGNPVPYVGEEYNAEKVNNLKIALLEALKDATNIRNLKPGDSITVCVFGGPISVMVPVKTKTSGASATASAGELSRGDVPALHGRLVREVPLNRTVMTIRVKKSDVDAFAKGKLNLDEFRKKASITAYVGSSGGNEGTFGAGFGGGFGGGGSFGGGGLGVAP